jgi:transcriptional regulator of acetoin/glycerol metabolism
LSRHANNISAAARDAGIDRNYLYRLIKKHDLE